MRWSFLSLLLVSASLAFAQGSVPPVRETHSFYKSGGKAVNVDIFAPPDQAKHPAVLVLHGSGGMTRIDRFHGVARYFAEQGYVALFPHYLDVTGQTSLSQSDVDHVVAFTARTKSGSFEARFDLWKRSIGDAI